MTFRLLIIIVVSILFPIFTYAQVQDVSLLESEKQDLLQEVTELEEKIDSYQDELIIKHQEISSLKNRIDIIDTRINKLNIEIKKTRNLISITKLNIQETQVAIDQASTDIEKNKAALADLLRSFYIIDNESLIERFLKYDTLSQILSETQYLNTIQSKLHLKLNETRLARRNLESHESILEKNKSQLEQKNQQLTIQSSAEKSERANKDYILKETRQQEQLYQNLLSEVEAERAEFMAKIAKIEEQILIQQNFISYFKAGEIPKPGTRIFIWPQDDPIITQLFGLTTYARRGAYGGKGHNGIDMTSGLATSVRAAAGGEVIAKGEQNCRDYINRSCNGFWGNWIAIQHPGGLVTLYSHLTKPATKNIGEGVKPAEIIGYEGATGNVTGPHLHFSIYTEFFTYKDPRTGVVRFSYNYPQTLNPLDYL